MWDTSYWENKKHRLKNPQAQGVKERIPAMKVSSVEFCRLEKRARNVHDVMTGKEPEPTL
jgi:hypothetical protein